MLEIDTVSKSFGGTVALRGVSFEVQPGEFHALLGANGAGKSTLVKMIAGIHAPDSGRIQWGGTSLGGAVHQTRLARLGIGVVHQESTLLPELSVAANFALGETPRRGPGWIDWERVRAVAQERAARFGVEMHPETPIGRLPVAQRKLVEILRALRPDQKLIVLDEPTAVFSREEAERLMQILLEIKTAGTAILYVTHRLHEIEQIVDRATVLKDGARVGTLAGTEASPSRIVSMMVGRELAGLYPPAAEAASAATPLLVAEGLTREPCYRNVDLAVQGGQIVALVSLAGHGSFEVARAFFGDPAAKSGGIALGGDNIRITGPRSALRAGVGFVSEDKEENVFSVLPVRDNLALAGLPRWSRFGWLRARSIRNAAREMIETFGIRTRSPRTDMASLSGGNQQKVVLARWLAADARLLVLLDPTAGVDVGARADIYRLLRSFAGDGRGVLIATSDLDEALGLADVVYALYRGEIAAVMPREGRREEDVLAAITGHSLEEMRLAQA